MADGSAIAITARHHPRARRWKLRYDGVRDLLHLTMPPRANAKAGLLWAGEQAIWIAAQRAKNHGVKPVEHGSVLPFVDGTLTIDWAEGRARRVEWAGDMLRVGGPRAGLARRVEKWLRAAAIECLTSETMALAASAGLACHDVSIGDPRSRWGSCSARGTIRYNWRLIMAPVAVRRAIVAHEVAHLRHMHHGADFHALVGELADGTDAAAYRWLKTHGRELHRWQFS